MSKPAADWSDRGGQGVDPPPPDPPQPPGRRPIERIVRSVAEARAHACAPGEGPIYGEPILVVRQKSKLIELEAEYTIYDASGRRIGAVRQIGQSIFKKALRLLTSVDQFLTHRFEVTDLSGTTLMFLERPRKIFKSRVRVSDGKGLSIGAIIQESVFGRIRFALRSGDRTVGSIQAENWLAWNFSIRDQNDVEVARITKTFEGLAETLLTTADNYVVQFQCPLDEPLRSLVVASALCVDVALKQDPRGLG
jgi:uncharacterized protein YxjI